MWAVNTRRSYFTIVFGWLLFRLMVRLMLYFYVITLYTLTLVFFVFIFTKTNKLKAGIKSKDRFGYEVVVSISKSIISCILFICCEHNAKENGFWLFSSGPEESRSYMN